MLGNFQLKSWAIAAGVAIMAASSAAATNAVPAQGAATPAAAGNRTLNPYSPAYGHPYRHGVFPTREAHARMKQYQALQATTTTAATGTQTLSYGGGVDGIGVTSGTPKVYIVVYGNQWGTASTNASGNMTLSGDAYGAVPYLENLFKGLGTGGELWSGVMTQYCDGSSVSTGATFCPSGAPTIGYPTGGAFVNIWYDNSVASPSQATGAQLAQEAIKAAQHFGNTTAASNRYVQYVILSPSGTHPDGFNTSTGQFCAWHDWNGDQSVTSPVGDVAFTNMPYVHDMGTSCGMNSVNGSAGALDGFSIVEGHEYAETVTDQNPAGGWTNHTGNATYNGQENGDECAWISSGQGATANVTMGNGTYPMQSTWSNDTNECDLSHPIVGGGTPTGGTPVANFGYTTSGLTANFTDSSTDSGGTLSAHSWTFGDGSSSTATSPSHTYAAGGTYSVSETVTDSVNAQTSTTTKSVTVSAGGGGSGLQNGVPVTGLAAATGAQLAYSVNIPAGATNLVISISGGTGDADLYTRFGAAPTLSSYDCRPYITGNNESCTVASPQAGTYYIMLNGYAAFSGVTLKATWSTGGGGGGNVLQNGVAATGLTATTGNSVNYTMVVTAGATNLSFKIAGSVGDADLYVKFGSAPTTSSYDCRPYLTGDNETCTISNVQAGTYYVMVRAYQSYSGVSLTGSYTP
ncbi:pre-peptidase C-terminal domain-containing protein [Rhodanobacter denitrificans]|uniref:pre-peptidase C-terminal domain-containing protein n=1 Tax=Rhodanobacter denitrificans TaxID=666685 RepID=UPI0002E3600A|nr:pre-peptidase C-terminal domain-containing protein [Rhodanobacter denitrificans]